MGTNIDENGTDMLAEAVQEIGVQADHFMTDDDATHMARLALYLESRVYAFRERRFGKIESAQRYERTADDLYDSLPKAWQW